MATGCILLQSDKKSTSGNSAKEDAFTRLSTLVAPELEAVNRMIRERMASEYAPRIPELSAHLIEAGEAASPGSHPGGGETLWL